MSNDNQKIEVQDLKPEHSSQIAKLRSICFPHLDKLSTIYSDEEVIRRSMKSTHWTKSNYIGIVYKGFVFGYIHYIILPKTGIDSIYGTWGKDFSITRSRFNPQIELKYICVKPKMRNLKAGQKLMDELVKRYKRIFLQTDRGTHESAKHIYNKYRFKNIDKTDAKQFYYRS